MNIEAKNITAAIRVIDNKVAGILKEYKYKYLTDSIIMSGGQLLYDFKVYTSALVDYCRMKYNDEVADFLSRYIAGRSDYLNATMKQMKKDYAVSKAHEKLRAILTNSPGTADALIKSASGDEIIDFVNSYVDARHSYMSVNGQTCINIFYDKLNELCAKYNCTHSI